MIARQKLEIMLSKAGVVKIIRSRLCVVNLLIDHPGLSQALPSFLMLTIRYIRVCYHEMLEFDWSVCRASMLFMNTSKKCL